MIRIKWGSVLVRKTMPTELATFVKMSTLISLIALNVTALQITQLLTLIFVIRIKWGNVLVRKTMATELAMNAQMGTLIILIANPVTVNLITQQEQYVIKLMDHAHV